MRASIHGGPVDGRWHFRMATGRVLVYCAGVAVGGTGAWASTKAAVPAFRATEGKKMIEVLKPR